MKINRSLAGLLSAGLLLWATPAFAMGSGNPYEDAQVGLDYVVYQPIATAGLSLAHFGMNPCRNNHDEQIIAKYGSAKRYFIILENSRKWSCHVAATIVNGATKTVLLKPSADMLTGTSITLLAVGLSSTEINKVVASLKPRYIAQHSTR